MIWYRVPASCITLPGLCRGLFCAVFRNFAKTKLMKNEMISLFIRHEASEKRDSGDRRWRFSDGLPKYFCTFSTKSIIISETFRKFAAVNKQNWKVYDYDCNKKDNA